MSAFTSSALKNALRALGLLADGDKAQKIERLTNALRGTVPLEAVMPTCRPNAPKRRKMSAYQEASSRGRIAADSVLLPYYTDGMDKEALAELDAVVATGMPAPRETCVENTLDEYVVPPYVKKKFAEAGEYAKHALANELSKMGPPKELLDPTQHSTTKHGRKI